MFNYRRFSSDAFHRELKEELLDLLSDRIMDKFKGLESKFALEVLDNVQTLIKDRQGNLEL